MLRAPDPVDPGTLMVGVEACRFQIIPANMRQDNLDTPAAVGSPVGMFIDTAVANTLGADIVTNGAFPTNTTGWTALNATLSVVAARLRIALSGAVAGQARQTLTTVAGRVYKMTLDLVTNANGARFSVGTAAGGSNLFDLTVAGGVTGTYTFYFIATSATSFLQLRTNSTTSGHFTEWDNVTCKHIPGKHMIQQDPARRIILRQHAFGFYYLENDGVDDFMVGPSATTLQLPSYLYFGFYRQSEAVGVIWGMFKNSTNHLYVGNRTLNLMQAVLREGVIGQVLALLKPLAFGVGRRDCVDSLSIVGTHDINSGRTIPPSVANSWLAGTQLTLVTPGIYTSNGSTGIATASGFLSGEFGWINIEPTPTQRAGIRRFVNDIIGGD